MNEKIFEIIIDDFSSGMVTNIDEAQKPSDGFKEIKNGRLDITEGKLVKRLPATQYNSVSLGSDPVLSGIRYYYGDSNAALIISHSTSLYKGGDALGTFTVVDTGYATNSTFDYLTYKDRLYICNGTDSNKRYDGTNIKTWGCSAPSVAPSLSSTASGDLTGDFFYKLTFQYDGYSESNPSTASATVTLSSEKATMSITTSADPACTGRKLYRTKNGGSTYYLVATIANNTATTYEDNITDASLVTAVEENHDALPVLSQTVLHKGRIFGLVPNSCKITHTPIDNYVSYPDYYDSTVDYDLISEDDGSNVVAICEHDEGIICFKRTGIFILRTYNNDPLQWTIDKIDDHGTDAPWSVASTADGIMFLHRDKYRQKDLRILPGTVRNCSQSIGWKIKDVLDTIRDQNLDDVRSVYYGGRYYLSFRDNYSGLDYNHKVLILQVSKKKGSVQYSYTVDDLPIGCFIPAYGAGDEGQMYAGRSDMGKIMRIETGNTDIVHLTAGDFEDATLTRVEEGGSEEYPEYTLDADADWSGEISGELIDSITSSIDSVTTFIDYTGMIVSPVLYIGAIDLKTLFWSQELSSSGYIRMKIRTGDTEAECSTATWSEFFTVNTGSDISGVDAKDYIQYAVYISSNDLPDADTKLKRDTFLVKISAGLGTTLETAINFVLDSGIITLGKKGMVYRVRWVDLEYNSTSGQTVRLYLKKNEEEDFGDPVESVLTADNPYYKRILLPFSYIGEYFNFKLTEQSTNPFKLKSIRIGVSELSKKAYMLRR